MKLKPRPLEWSAVKRGAQIAPSGVRYDVQGAQNDVQRDVASRQHNSSPKLGAAAVPPDPHRPKRRTGACGATSEAMHFVARCVDQTLMTARIVEAGGNQPLHAEVAHVA